MSRSENCQSFATSNVCEIYKEVLNTNPCFDNSPNHIWMRCDNLDIKISESIFTNQPYFAYINNKYYDISSWSESLLKDFKYTLSMYI